METDVFLQNKKQWKWVQHLIFFSLSLSHFLIPCSPPFLVSFSFIREEIDAKLVELQSMERDLTNKQLELDQREKILEEKEKQLKEGQSQCQDHQPPKPRVRLSLGVFILDAVATSSPV